MFLCLPDTHNKTNYGANLHCNTEICQEGTRSGLMTMSESVCSVLLILSQWGDAKLQELELEKA